MEKNLHRYSLQQEGLVIQKTMVAFCLTVFFNEGTMIPEIMSTASSQSLQLICILRSCNTVVPAIPPLVFYYCTAKIRCQF